MDYLLENLITKTGLTLPDREAYLQDPALIYMRWAAEWETPEWMLDYDLKKEQLFGGKGTQDVWVNAHRADHLGKPGGNFLNVTENWRRLADQGVRLIMTNDPLGMVRFAAKYHNQ